MDQDLEAIRRWRDGDADAFRALVERYEREAIAHARSILGHREDALDMVQEAFFDAYRALDRFDCQREFYPWFYVILRNRCYQLLKSREKHSAVSLDARRDSSLNSVNLSFLRGSIVGLPKSGGLGFINRTNFIHLSIFEIQRG